MYILVSPQLPQVYAETAVLIAHQAAPCHTHTRARAHTHKHTHASCFTAQTIIPTSAISLLLCIIAVLARLLSLSRLNSLQSEMMSLFHSLQAILGKFQFAALKQRIHFGAAVHQV